MNCAEAALLIAPYADGEVDGLRKRAIERHLRDCAKCAAEHEEIVALRTRLRAEVPYFAATPGLRERVRAAVAQTPVPPPRRPASLLRPRDWFARGSRGGYALANARPAHDQWRWVSGGALAGCAATLTAFVLGTAVLDWRADRDLVAQAVATHVRATLDKDLIAVASSDQHTVKPWLSARLDYSPPVLDLAKDGFPLVGGRLDTLEKRPCATLVYRYRNHMIDVFVRPESSDAPAMRTMRGFNVAHARGAGWDWLAVSDVSSDVLAHFVERLAREAPTP
jgi:anti-sigma factor RsiW